MTAKLWEHHSFEYGLLPGEAIYGEEHETNIPDLRKKTSKKWNKLRNRMRPCIKRGKRIRMTELR